MGKMAGLPENVKEYLLSRLGNTSTILIHTSNMKITQK